MDQNKLTFIRHHAFNKGTFPAEDYDAVRDYFKAMANADKAKLVLLHK